MTDGYVAFLFYGNRYRTRRFREEGEFVDYMHYGSRKVRWGHLFMEDRGTHVRSIHIPEVRVESAAIRVISKRKKRIPDVGMVYPCVQCGLYPEWGSGFLMCPGDHYESVGNRPSGAAVRDWNRHNQPTKRRVK